MKSTSKDSDLEYCHNLARGDHVMRWTHVMLYPIQVHGIVLSAGHDIVTIVDFGLTAAKSQEHKEIKESAASLEDMIDQEDKAMIEDCERHRKEHVGADRIHIITLTEEKEILKWKKVNYGESLMTQKHWRWWKNDKNNSSKDEKEEKNNAAKEEQKKTDMTQVEEKVNDADAGAGPSANTVADASDNAESASAIEIPSKKPTGWFSCMTPQRENAEKSTSKDQEPKEEQPKVPRLPKSDPEHLVISRVRYLLTNPQDLPPHHLLFANSECIAVWCKTGAWGTLQASIFLYSTAAGNLKTAILSSAGVAGATTTVTVPATGIAGWFGMTTTATVSLVSVQPWLVPALAGYGLIAVGTPMILAIKAKERWENATMKLNNGFWGNADADVYVEAIKSWSGLE